MTFLIAIPLKRTSEPKLFGHQVANEGLPNPLGGVLTHARNFVHAEAPRTLHPFLNGNHSLRADLPDKDVQRSLEVIDLKDFAKLDAKLVILIVEEKSGLTAKQFLELPKLWKPSRELLAQLGLDEWEKLDFARAIVLQNEQKSADSGLTKFVNFKPLDFHTRGRAITLIVTAQAIATSQILEASAPKLWNVPGRWKFASKVSRIERDLWWENLFEGENTPTLYADLQASLGLASRVKQLFEYARTIRSEVSLVFSLLNALILLAIAILSVS